MGGDSVNFDKKLRGNIPKKEILKIKNISRYNISMRWNYA